MGDPDVDERTISRWIFRKWDWGMEWTKMAQDSDRRRALMYVNEPSDSIKCEELLD